jgi:hypothetical protein
LAAPDYQISAILLDGDLTDPGDRPSVTTPGPAGFSPGRCLCHVAWKEPMDANCFVALLRALTGGASRRGLLAGLVGGVLTASPFGLGGEKVSARRNGQHQRRRKQQARRKKRKQGHGGNQQPPSPPPPPPPAPVVRADARCIGNSDIDFGVIENGRQAQTFTALSSGALVRAELTIAKDEDALDEWFLRLSPVDSTGVPTSDVLAETSVPDTSVAIGTSAPVAFDFANPFPVVAGTTYALVLTRGEFFRWAARDGNPCQGAGFASSDQTAPFNDVHNDFVFRTFVAS